MCNNLGEFCENMSLIEGIGDEVTHFFIAVAVILIASVAWWTTSISEQRHVRHVLLLDRRRHRAHQRLTNHTETVTITEGTTTESSDTTNTEEVNMAANAEKPPEPSTSEDITDISNANEEDSEENTIIQTMDSDAYVLRQRRLNFFDPNMSPASSQTTNKEILPENESIADEDENVRSTDSNENSPKSERDKDTVTIKLKFINDDLKVVDAKLDEKLGDFKRRLFESEISSNKLVRLIFNGHVLAPEQSSLQSLGLFHNCVVHCLIHNRRASPGDNANNVPSGGIMPDLGLAGINGIPNLNNNNQGRDWDLGNILIGIVGFILSAAWYTRYVYAHLYTVTATIGLVFMTGIFTIVIVGLYFPDITEPPRVTVRPRMR